MDNNKVDNRSARKECEDSIRKYYESEIECGSPKIVMYFSKEQRERCIGAKVTFMNSFINCIEKYGVIPK